MNRVSVARLVDLLDPLLGATRERLGVGLDLLVRALDDGQDGAHDDLLHLEAGVDEGLSVDAHVLEESGHATQGLVEMLAVLRDCLRV